MRSNLLRGAEPLSHRGCGSTGVLIVHGFTGTPWSMAPTAQAAVAADLPVEQPLLAGHGSVVEDMLETRWADWLDDTVQAYKRLLQRCDQVVAVGQSMGGTLVLSLAGLSLAVPPLAAQRGIAGLVCINPLTQPRSAAELELIDDLLEDQIVVVPGEGSDIADPTAVDQSYAGTPLAPIRSLLTDGVAPLSSQLGALTAPLLLFTSRNDHVVEPSNSDYLARQYGGTVDHRWLERSYHVAALDYDRDLIAAATVAFVQQLAKDAA